MASARSGRGHTVVVAVVGVAALLHAALAVVPSGRAGWVVAVSAVLALAGLVTVGLGLWSPRAVFGGDAEDAWLVACAGIGALGVAAGLGLAVATVATPGAGFDPAGLAALVVDAVVTRVAVFTLRRAPAGR